MATAVEPKLLHEQIANLSLSDEPDEEIILIDIFTASSLGIWTFPTTHNIDVNSINLSGWTGLMYAAYYGHLHLVRLFLKCGADLNAQNNTGRSALTLAAMCGQEEVCRVLLLAGANCHLRDKREWSALFYCTYFNQHTTVKLLLEFGADPNETESVEGLNPFLLSVRDGHELIFRYFIEFKADLRMSMKNGEKVEDLAKRNMKMFQLYRLAICREMAGATGATRFDIEENRTRVCFENLGSLLASLRLEKYLKVFEEQDVDLQVFLTLSDNDLKDIGITRMGPRRKMTVAIARLRNASSIKE